LELQHLVRSDCWNLNWDRNVEVPMLANLLIWRLIAIPLVVATILAFMFLFSVGYFQLPKFKFHFYARTVVVFMFFMFDE
jgi:hypothetical protein